MPDIVPIEFGEFLPDNPDFQNPGCLKAENVIPIAGGAYAPFRSAGTAAGTGINACRGAALYERSTGDTITVGGSSDRLWVDVAGTVTETLVTDIGDNYWQFQRLGSRVLAVAPNNDMYQLADLNSDTAWTVVSDAPTRAEVIGEVGSRLIVGNLVSNPYGFEWSALNDPLTWTATTTNYNGSAEVDQNYGEITGIAGDRFPAIFQKFAVSRITRVGPPAVFQVDRIEEARGCIAPQSIATVGHLTYFLAHDGFAVTNGAEVRLIGSNRVNRYFLEDVSDNDRFRTHAAIDWANECVVWAYYRQGGSGFEGLMIYSWAQNRWSTAVVDVDWLVSSAVAGVTLDGLDALYGSLDSIPVSLDAAQWQAGQRRLSAYIPVKTELGILLYNGLTPVILDNSGTKVIFTDPDLVLTTLKAFDGTTLEATFETSELQVQPGKRTFINRVYPIVENTAENTQAAVTTRNIKGGDLVTSARGTVNDAGYCPVRADGRYARVQLTIPAAAEWRKAQGVQVGIRRSGGR